MTTVTPLTAVYPGTFDPMTLGHEDLMRRAAHLFDRLILAVAVGHHKRTLFTIEERLQMAAEIAAPYPNVEVLPFSGLLRDFVVDHNGDVVVRDRLRQDVVMLASTIGERHVRKPPGPRRRCRSGRSSAKEPPDCTAGRRSPAPSVRSP